MKKIVLICTFIFLAACNKAPTEDASHHQEAVTLMQDFSLAEKENNWLLAQQNAEVLIARFPESEQAKALQSRMQDINAKALAMQEERRLATLWDYQQVAVGKKTQYSAGIYSKQEMLGGEPTDLPPAARMIVRIHPEWGNSVYLVLAQSQFQCGSPCTMKISFDGAEYKTFPGKQADTGTGPALFIENDKVFYKALLAAKNIKIKVKGVPDLEYEVASYDAEKLGAEF